MRLPCCNPCALQHGNGLPLSVVELDRLPRPRQDALTPLTILAHLVRKALLLEHDERLKGIAAAPQRATGPQLLVLSALLQPQQRRLGRRRERKPVRLMPSRHMVYEYK